jgi:WD40 repeat protein
MLAVGFNDRQVKVWDTRNWEELATIKGHGNTINSIAFSPDGRMLATASSDSTVKYWDLMKSQGPKVFNLNDSVVSEVAFSNTGKTLFVSSYNSTTFTNMDIRAYDIASGHETFSIQGPAINTKRNLSPQYRHLFALSGDGRRIALAGDKSIKIIDAITGKQIVETQSPGGRVELVALSQDGRVISAICEGDREYITIVWNSDTGKESLRFNSPQRSSDGLVFLDNQTLLTLGPELQWWNLYRGKLTRQSETRLKHIGGVRLSPDGMRMAVTDRDGKIFLLDASTGQQQLEIKGFNASVRELAFSNDGKRLLAGGEADRIVKLFDLTTGQETISFPISRSTGGCAFSPDGRNVAITYLNSVKVYTAVDPKSVQVAGR